MEQCFQEGVLVCFSSMRMKTCTCAVINSPADGFMLFHWSAVEDTPRNTGYTGPDVWSKTTTMTTEFPWDHQLSLLTCEGSGKREALDWAGAWRLVSPEGWRNSASELYVYLAGPREKQIQIPKPCTPHCGFNQLVQTEDTHCVKKCSSYLSNFCLDTLEISFCMCATSNIKKFVPQNFQWPKYKQIILFCTIKCG